MLRQDKSQRFTVREDETIGNSAFVPLMPSMYKLVLVASM